ncbi:MAG: hypothetical protein KME30_30285 [Iphinoe sp. HA4291-MV1]|jgi:hypothetical protein|nr:hypothetical protein [Iphinoe sp. HA4291-MV1]
MSDIDSKTQIRDLVILAKHYSAEKFIQEVFDLLLNEHAYTLPNLLWGTAQYVLEKEELKEIGLKLERCWSDAQTIEDKKHNNLS